MHCGLERPHVVHFSKQQIMSIADFKRVLNIMGPYIVSMGFGCLREPLVHPKIRDLFLLSEDHGSIMGISLATNGVLLDRSLADFMISTSLEWNVDVSMESSNPVTYEKIRRGSKFNLIKDNIEYLIQIREKAGNKIKVNFSSVIFNINLPEFSQLFDFAESLGIDSIKPMHLQVHDGNMGFALGDKERKNMYEVIENLKQRSDNSHLNLMLEEFYKEMNQDHTDDDQCSIAVMNQTGHIYPPGYRRPIGTVLNPDDLNTIMDFYGLD
jgi:molybdenum cofactor biosynthesis enzyme MoaA